MRNLSLAAGLAAALTISSAVAEGSTVPPQRIKGTIETFDPAARTLAVVTGKKHLVVALRSDARIIYNQKRKLADLKAGDFVGAAALKASGGTLRAQQVVLFPEALRGMGEGQYPMGDPAFNRVMTNATVADAVSVAANSGTLKLSYHGAAAAADGSCGGHANAAGGTGCTGEADIVVATGVPVLALMLGDESLLVPGAAVSLIAVAAPEGQLETSRLTVEKDGVKPIL